MRLIELKPQWLKYTPEGDQKIFTRLEDCNRGEADGIVFLCPLCFAKNGGSVGTHSVICWFEDRVPEDLDPKPGRWNPIGTGFDDLSFVPGKKSNSVLLIGGCAWHGFITNGEVT